MTLPAASGPRKLTRARGSQFGRWEELLSREEAVGAAGSGVLIFEDVFDAATGDYITTNVSFTGPRPECRRSRHLRTVGCYLLDS